MTINEKKIGDENANRGRPSDVTEETAVPGVAEPELSSVEQIDEPAISELRAKTAALPPAEYSTSIVPLLPIAYCLQVRILCEYILADMFF